MLHVDSSFTIFPFLQCQFYNSFLLYILNVHIHSFTFCRRCASCSKLVSFIIQISRQIFRENLFKIIPVRRSTA